MEDAGGSGAGGAAPSLADISSCRLVAVVHSAIIEDVTAVALDTEYENGVADVLAFLAADAATVERNVRMAGRKSGKPRQIDVKVSGALFGSGSATMVVDCKRYTKPLDVTHVGAFLGLVEDVGADIGLLVCSSGVSPAAQQYAHNVRGIRLDVVSVEQLAAWSPRGTINFAYAVPEGCYSEAVRAVRRAGFRVRPIEVPEWRGEVGLGFDAFRHLGVLNPAAELQVQARDKIESALRRVGVLEPVGMESGIVMMGGTPGHRSLNVTIGGMDTGVKLITDSEEDISRQLDALSRELFVGVPRDQLDVVRPEVWPIPIMFPRW